ncbi:MAG: stage 0 sporulation family protein [Dehalococcoidales bacterium]|nr:MAG: stage 0 sporulation family protein [Dehalococcoidales bacterium]
MTEVVGVRFKRAGRIYYFDPADVDFELGDYVVVETARGLEVGQVAIAPKDVPESDIAKPLKPVVRKAEPTELNYAEQFEEKEREALEICGELIAEMDLPMKLLSAEYGLDGKHLTFYFSAAERVDFRQLVRELAGRFKVRVELRQVGARDETKLLGGFGRCGRGLCCANFLSEFAPISIRMAKEQSLPLNPMKISGLCGRLLCCLAYENEQYREMQEKMPKEGQKITTATGTARVVGSNLIKETVLIELESKVVVELPLNEVVFGEGKTEASAETEAEAEAEVEEPVETSTETKPSPPRSGRRRGKNK